MDKFLNTTQAIDNRRRAPISMDEQTFRKAGYLLVDRIADFLASLPDRPITRGESPEAVRAVFDAEVSLPERGMDELELLDSTAGMLFDHSLFNGHPRFFGYITSSPAPIGMLGDFLASAINANVGAWALSPMATEIEAQAVRWIAELTGFPVDGGGLLVSGGNMANLVGIFAARAAAADWDLRKEGYGGPNARRLRIYASFETHTWIHKATDLSGLGTDAIRWIPTDSEHRMDLTALRTAIEADRAAGEVPMAVVGTAGSVSLGVLDPLREMAAICREEGIWFHIDGAYGGFAAALPGLSPEFEGFALADSVALDPHKWLYAPLEAGCTLVRDPETLRRAFSYHPPYYHFGTEVINYFDLGPQNSRGFRALKVWLALRQVGRQGYVQMIKEDIRLSERLFDRVAAHPEIEALTQHLSVTTFRYIPLDLQSEAQTEEVATYLSRLNEALLDRIQNSGEVFVSNAVIDGNYVLRACIVNFNTSESDIDAIPEIVARLGREVDARLRMGQVKE